MMWWPFLKGWFRRYPNSTDTDWLRERRQANLDRLEREVAELQRQVQELKWPRG